MKINSHKYITNIINVNVNPLSSELSKLITSSGVWREGVYTWSKGSVKINPVEDFLSEFRSETLKKYDEMNDDDLFLQTDKLSNFFSKIIDILPEKESDILNTLNKVCKEISNANKKTKFDLTIKIVNDKGKTLNKIPVRVSETKSSSHSLKEKTGENKPIKLNLSPKVYFIKSNRRRFFFFKKEINKVISLFSDREIEIKF